MAQYSEYLDRNMDYPTITAERKKQLKRISDLRGGRDVLVYASDLNKGNAPILIDYTDILPFQDQLTNLKGKSIDIILETPGGFAEVVEDLVKLVRDKYVDGSVGIIIPGYSKSAGTIFAMAGDEILMGASSALGPIDAQISNNGKKYSAEAFLEGLNKIKQEASSQRLNLAYVPILQNISPGEIQHCENAQTFSKTLVTQWLAKYKFSPWKLHSTTGKPVTDEDKLKRANEIGEILCKHSEWLTHGRSIKIDDFKKMKLLITDYRDTPDLDDAITRYYALMRMSFEGSQIYKLFETVDSQIARFLNVAVNGANPQQNVRSAKFNFDCPNCHTKYEFQANLEPNEPYEKGVLKYPVENNIFVCPKCRKAHNLVQARLQIESQSGKKVQK
jgi:hypothetical protein